MKNIAKVRIRNAGALCIYCKVREANSVDHKIPRRYGGKDTIGNLVFCCDLCNKEKGSLISYELFLRFSRRFGPVEKGWCKKTNKEETNAAVHVMLSKKTPQERKGEILNRRFAENIVRRAKIAVDKNLLIR